MFKALLNLHTKGTEKFDYDLAKDLKKAIININENDPVLNDKKFFFEGIFLDLTDRTEKHPRMPIITKKRDKNIMSPFNEMIAGGEQRDIEWVLNDVFITENYFKEEWFDPSISMNQELEKQLINAKNLYKKRSISFFQFFLKRMEVYENVKPENFIKFYSGVDFERYKKKLRDILEIIL